MEIVDHMGHLNLELNRLEGYLDEDLSVPVRHCGSWTLLDLADHLGRGFLWAAMAVAEKRGDYEPPPAPRHAPELLTWFHTASTVLLNALDTDPGAAAWTFFPPRTVGFWRRRMCLEALVHRWDVEQAIGLDTGLDPALAGDGVAEVIDTLAPRQMERGRAEVPRQAVRFHATDTGSSWLFGRGEPVAVIGAESAVLLLMLWGRIPRDDRAITWEGDQEAAQTVLRGPLIP